MAPRQGLELAGELRTYHHRQQRPDVVLHWRAGPIGGQLQQRRRTGQGALPVGGLPLQEGIRHPLPFPDCVVGVLNRQGRQRIVVALAEGAVQLGELPAQYAHRPTIGDGVVQRQQQGVLAFGQPQQPPANQGPRLQIKGLRRFLLQPAGQLQLSIGRLPEVVLAQGKAGVCRRHDSLHRLPVHRHKRGAQRLVAHHQLFQRRPQRPWIQLARQTPGQRHVVGGRGAFQLGQEPQPPLRKRQGQWLAPIGQRDQPTLGRISISQAGGKLRQQRPCE